MQNQLDARVRELHLSPEEHLLFTLITRSPMKKTDLKRETKMDSRQLDTILRELESRRTIKKTKQSGKKINTWVRYDYEDVQTDKVDTSIVEVLKDIEGDIEQIRSELKRKGYNVTDLDLIINSLVNRGVKYKEGNTLINRQIKPLVNPCVGCPVFELCCPSGPISPATCIYYDEW